MALPWLIGAAAVALGAAVVSAISDDSDSGNGDDDGEERRRRERAEKERKEKAHKEKLQAMKDAFIEDGLERVNALEQSLSGLIQVSVLGNQPFKAVLDTEDSNRELLSPSYVEINDLPFLSQETQQNLVKFESLYDVELEPEEDLIQYAQTLKAIDDKLEQLHQLRSELELSIYSK
ncbi:hypothetical protein EFU53_002895 [Vibrio cholerae]|uniref:hypothetical protein n=1 Tax=Vibrio TaxID=662 RepID=UPI000DE44111|nr:MULTISPECIES: hypothetical protein [Vibrio]RBM61844.1 hypothetical protein DLR67_05935 [Vibrio paracholerae]TYA07670.1 hypothetical protein FXE34_14245 [Vibrio cholerae]